LTRHFAKLSISPESSDGFASVGTILPKEEAALLPGGLFAFQAGYQRGWETLRDVLLCCVEVDRRRVGECVSARRVEALAMVGVLVIIGFAVLLVAPCLVAASIDLDEEDAN
jgi:hypothetical protein